MNDQRPEAARPQIDDEAPSPSPIAGATRPPATEDDQAVEADLETMLADLRKERDSFVDLAQRTRADFENYRRRMNAAAADAERRGRASVVKEILPAVDNFARALSAESSNDPSALLEGLRMVERDLAGALERVGVSAYEPLGEKFDPTVHEAVTALPDETSPPDSVIQVFEKGYRLGDTVLRPARVVVAKAPPDDTRESSG